MSAILSSCGTYRYRLEREVQPSGLVIAYFGINASTATATVDDHTVRKWIGFARVNNGRRIIVGNTCAYRASDVAALARAADPVGPENDFHLTRIVDDADVLVPCWGSRQKVPRALHCRLDALRERLFDAGKPVLIWGLTRSGDPIHPLMLGYATPLLPWVR